MYIFNNPDLKNLRQKLRNTMPSAEVILWAELKGKQLFGYKFRRQYGVGRYVVDFYCARIRLAIELDGDSHFQIGVEEYDKKREEYIESRGIKVIRFTNTDVYENLDGVILAIIEELPEQQVQLFDI